MQVLHVNVAVANLYAHPDEWSEVVSQSIYGWCLEKLGEETDFYQVRGVDHYTGWIAKKDVCERAYAIGESFVKIIRNAAHVYGAPDVSKSKPLMTLPFEVCLPFIDRKEEEEGRWIQVSLLDGRTGWIQKGDITYQTAVYSWQEAVRLSQQFLGLPYTWGGVSSFGYDCSGFIQMLGRQAGMTFPRDARDQIKSPLLKAILEESPITAGDLIFFGPAREKITHVGLAISSQEMIHASVHPSPLLQTILLDDLGLKKRFSFRQAYRLQN
jgi:hypothetical protein